MNQLGRHVSRLRSRESHLSRLVMQQIILPGFATINFSLLSKPSQALAQGGEVTFGHYVRHGELQLDFLCFQLRCSLPSSPSLPPKASSRVNSVPFSTPSRRFVVRAEEASAPPPTGAGCYRSCQAATAKWPTERCRGICLYSSIIHTHTHILYVHALA